MTPQLADITSSDLFDVANFVFKFSYWFMTMDTHKSAIFGNTNFGQIWSKKSELSV